MKFSKFEIKEIVKAWVAVSLMFAIAFGGLKGLAVALPISLLTAGVGFLLHELAHKYVAQRYRLWAEFRANNKALILGIVVSFAGLILAAPGGVFIRGGTNKNQHGRIAFAGPLTNIIIAVAFFGLSYLATNDLLSVIAMYGFKINALLAIFNMIPFPPFDGASVWKWNKAVWVGGVAVGIVLMMLPI